MTKKMFDINGLRVAAPCSVSWETMTGDDRRRFCELCQLNVYNFSEMTAGEVRQFIAESEGRICGRLYRRTDGSVLTKDCPVGFRAYRKRITRLAGAALSSVLALFSVSFGQKTDEKPTDASNVKIVRMTNCETVLSGTVTDSEGAVVPGAEIKLYRDKIYQRSQQSNVDGEFSFSALASGDYTFEINSPGFKSFRSDEIVIGDNEQVSIDIKIKLEVGEFTVGIIVTSDPVEVGSDSEIQKNIIHRKPEKRR